MFPTLAQRLSSLKNYAPELDMVFATLFAGGAILGCRLMASLVSSNSAEFDGFVFLAAVYWIYSVVGYFTSRARSYRQWGTYLRRRCTPRSAIIATTVLAGLLGIAAAL